MKNQQLTRLSCSPPASVNFALFISFYGQKVSFLFSFIFSLIVAYNILSFILLSSASSRLFL